MYNKLYISKVDEVYAHIKCENSDAMELNEYFTFYVPGYKFMPAFRNKVWDGKIRLFNSQNRQIYYGLIPYLEKFAKEREYEIEFDESVETYDEFSVAEAKEFIDTLGIPFEVRDYQIDAFIPTSIGRLPGARGLGCRGSSTHTPSWAPAARL